MTTAEQGTVTVSGSEKPHDGLLTIGESLGLVTSCGYGPLPHSPYLRLRVGGAEANVAVGVRRLGHNATWCGVVGEDPVGELILRELRAESVGVRARAHTAPTAIMMKERRTRDLFRVHYWRAQSAGSQLASMDVPEDAITQARLLHLTGITPALGEGPREAVLSAVSVARAAGTPISLDLNYRSQLWERELARPVLRDLVKNVDIVFASSDEAALILGEATPEKLAIGLTELGPPEATVKLGTDGAMAACDGKVLHETATEVRTIDLVGAGDAFAAGYLAAWLDDASLRARLLAASKAAAFAVSTDGDWEGLPGTADLAEPNLGSSIVLR